MMNLSLDELRLAQARNISDYENKSKEDLIKLLSETKPKPKSKPKSETKPKPKPKSETKPKPKPESEPELEIKVNKKKF